MLLRNSQRGPLIGDLRCVSSLPLDGPLNDHVQSVASFELTIGGGKKDMGGAGAGDRNRTSDLRFTNQW
jgi:hypothetical protein